MFSGQVTCLCGDKGIIMLLTLCSESLSEALSLRTPFSLIHHSARPLSVHSRTKSLLWSQITCKLASETQKAFENPLG